jgi:hypothetical protein
LEFTYFPESRKKKNRKQNKGKGFRFLFSPT